MIRTVALLTSLLTTACAFAQWSGGPLTITASPGSHARPAAGPERGGAPYNDLCQNAVVQALPPEGSVTVTGDNTGSTDTEDFGNPVCWEAFSIDTCSTVTVSYCGTDPLFGVVYSILLVGCPDPTASIQNSDTSLCGDGNVVILYENLSAGTYHIPVLLSPGVAAGPYTITITAELCDLPPLNDICSAATLLPVVTDCAAGTLVGNNANAVINSAPPCASTSSQFQDVWYQFDSGADTQVVITIDPGTIGDLGVEVRDACAGNSIFCATGDTSYLVEVDPATNYRVRVFSNNDFGFGGSFSICISVPPGTCEAGTVSVVGGATSITVCGNGGDPVEFTQSGSSGGASTFILTDEEDTIVTVLIGDALDPDGLLPGVYHVWAVVHDGELVNADPGEAVSAITASGTCSDISPDPVIVIVEICQTVQDAPTPVWNVVVLSTPDGVLVRWSGAQEPVRLELMDARGRSVARSWSVTGSGQRYLASPTGPLAHGIYLLRATGVGGSVVQRIFAP